MLRYLSLQLVSNISDLCSHDPPTSQTDGWTDKETDRRHVNEMCREELLKMATGPKITTTSPQLTSMRIHAVPFLVALT